MLGDSRLLDRGLGVGIWRCGDSAEGGREGAQEAQEQETRNGAEERVEEEVVGEDGYGEGMLLQLNISCQNLLVVLGIQSRIG